MTTMKLKHNALLFSDDEDMYMSNYSTTDMTAVDQLLVTITANMVRVRVRVRVRVSIRYIPIPIDEPLAYTIYTNHIYIYITYIYTNQKVIHQEDRIPHHLTYTPGQSHYVYPMHQLDG